MRQLDQKGYSLVEVLLALAAFLFVVTALTGLYIYGRQNSGLAGNRERATLLADEALEAIRNIRDASFTNLTNGTYGLQLSGNAWSLCSTCTTSGTNSDITDSIYTRQVTISPVDANTKQIAVTVSWQQNLQRPGTVSLNSQLTNWRVAGAAASRKGMLVYGNGGTTTDAIQYKILQSDGTWSAAASAADVDTGSTNRALRSVQVYASSTRDEKIMISRHYNGSAQTIYAQVWNGSSWGNVVQLSTWNATTFLDVRNFDGVYLANGKFMAIYSDNTTLPKYRIWNGNSWETTASLPNIGGIPSFMVAEVRPGTDEVMAAFFDQGSDTNTTYYNGTSWTLHAEHATAAPSNARRMVDFAWSPNNPLKGALIYSSSSTDKRMNIKIWTANGNGGGTWSATANTANQSTNIGSISVTARDGADEFLACNKDTSVTPVIRCYESDFTPTWITPANNTIGSTDTGTQRSYEVAFEAQSGNPAITVYSDGTNIPKLKKYDPANNSWDAAPTNINPLGAALETIRFNREPNSDNIMILLGDTNQDVYSLAWDGINNTFYTTPSGKAFSMHGTNGAADENYWFDFAWDKF